MICGKNVATTDHLTARIALRLDVGVVAHRVPKLVPLNECRRRLLTGNPLNGLLKWPYFNPGPEKSVSMEEGAESCKDRTGRRRLRRQAGADRRKKPPPGAARYQQSGVGLHRHRLPCAFPACRC